MSRLFRRAASCGALLCLFVSGECAFAADEFPVSEAQMRSLGITVQRLDAPRPIAGLTYPAQVTLPRSAERVISAPVEGMVSQVLTEESASVKRGAPLLRFDSPAFGTLQLEVLEAASSERLAEQGLARARQLFAEGIVPQRRLDEANATTNTARARLTHAKAALRLAGADERSIKAIADGGTTLDALIIRARESGTVLKVEVRPGQRVAPGDVLMRVGDVGQLWLEIQLPAPSSFRVEPGSSVAVVGREVSAKTLSVGATVGDGQTVLVRAGVTSGADRLRPGEFVQVRVPFGDSSAAWALPLGAVAYHDQKAYVFVRTEQGFTARPVVVAASAAQSVNVAGDLKSGEQVAVSKVVALKSAWLGHSGGE